MVIKHLGKVFPRSRGDGSIPLSSAIHKSWTNTNLVGYIIKRSRLCTHITTTTITLGITADTGIIHIIGITTTCTLTQSGTAGIDITRKVIRSGAGTVSKTDGLKRVVVRFHNLPPRLNSNKYSCKRERFEYVILQPIPRFCKS